LDLEAREEDRQTALGLLHPMAEPDDPQRLGKPVALLAERRASPPATPRALPWAEGFRATFGRRHSPAPGTAAAACFPRSSRGGAREASRLSRRGAIASGSALPAAPVAEEGARLPCPDWSRCHGRLQRPPERKRSALA